MRISRRIPLVNDFCYNMNNHPLKVSDCEKDLGIEIDSELNFSKHIASKVNKANSMCGLIRRTFSYIDNTTFKLLFTSLVRPHLEYGHSVWNPYKKIDITTVENVQRRASKLVPGLKDLTYEDRLKTLKMPTLAYRRFRGDLIEMFKLTHQMYDSSVITGLLDFKDSSTRGHVFTLHRVHFNMDIRKYFFTNRIFEYWNCLPSHVVNSDTVICFEARLDGIFSDSDIMYNPDTNFMDHINNPAVLNIIKANRQRTPTNHERL